MNLSHQIYIGFSKTFRWYSCPKGEIYGNEWIRINGEMKDISVCCLMKMSVLERPLFLINFTSAFINLFQEQYVLYNVRLGGILQHYNIKINQFFIFLHKYSLWWRLWHRTKHILWTMSRGEIGSWLGKDVPSLSPRVLLTQTRGCWLYPV